jgi:hypothetical protein
LSENKSSRKDDVEVENLKQLLQMEEGKNSQMARQHNDVRLKVKASKRLMVTEQ